MTDDVGCALSDNSRPPILPAHIEVTIEAIARLHADHQKRATPFQDFIANLTAQAGQPRFIAWLTAAVLCWIGTNLALHLSGRPSFDPPPFVWLELAASLAALYMTVMILSTQRRDDELAAYREQLTLELAILSDQRSAKIIQLIEELRRDMPVVKNRVDAEATAMSEPADPQAMLDTIQNMHDERTEDRARGAPIVE